MRAEGGKKVREKKSVTLVKVGSWSLGVGAIFPNRKAQCKAVRPNVEATESYPKEIAKKIDRGGYCQQQSPTVDETALP